MRGGFCELFSRYPVCGVTARVALLSTLLLLAGCSMVPFSRGKIDHSEVLALNNEGIAAFERKEYDEAERKFSQVAARDQNDLTSRRYYAETLWMRGKQKESIRLLNELSKMEGGSVDDLVAVNRSLAEKLLSEGEPMSALGSAERVIRYAPKSPDGWALRGMVAQQLGKNADAISDYQRAIHFDPENREVMRQLALLEEESGEYGNALAVWQQLGRTWRGGEEPIDILEAKGRVCRNMKQYAESTRYYEAALAQAPNDADLYRQLTDLYLERKDWARATSTLDRARGQIPESPLIQEYTARIERERLAQQPGPTPY